MSLMWVLTFQEKMKLSFDELYIKEQRNGHVFSAGRVRVRVVSCFKEEEVDIHWGSFTNWNPEEILNWDGTKNICACMQVNLRK